MIRAVDTRDLEPVEDILSDWLGSYSTPEQAKDEVARRIDLIRNSLTGETPCRFVVAEDDDGGIAGIMGLQSSDIAPELFGPDERPVELITAYLRRDRRGAGIGRALAEHVEAMAVEMGFTTLLVVSGSRNRESGYPFWRRRYGDPVRRDEDYWAPGAERVVWRLDLTATR